MVEGKLDGKESRERKKEGGEDKCLICLVGEKLMGEWFSLRPTIFLSFQIKGKLMKEIDEGVVHGGTHYNFFFFFLP